ncbi:hypothetical protein LOTGIDRAFT_232423 [Lottia gigantea]|uniref:Neurobeachin-like protein 1 n=1 Tax=Lottia gigantea TaxID=225164 RepID=V4ABG6_LOTGI|nr:hypothetical protein LOTGIDRAFT_232423 [Lottia gigantea]ESO94157.1 hypothetical protein LOTGIDRAFT_232423 [Lottia gigantea]
MALMAQGDKAALDKFLEFFIRTHKEYLDLEFKYLNQGFCEEGPHLTLLPERILEVIGNYLLKSTDEFINSFDIDSLSFVESLVKCLIIICRNYDNVPLVASCDFVAHTVLISSSTIDKICKEPGEEKYPQPKLLSFIQHVTHFLECLYDPYFVWRKRLKRWKIDKSQFEYKPAFLHNEVVPFFHECFQKENLPTTIQIQVLHLFGAIISGVLHNALKAITPATLDVLLTVLSSERVGEADSNQDFIRLKDLVLKCIVRLVHVIHCCSPDQRQIEVSEVMEGYMNVLQNIQSHLPNDSQLQLTMISTVNEMLGCNDRDTLQVLLVNDGTFHSFISLLHQTTLTGKSAQHLAISVIQVLQTILYGSQQAKSGVDYIKFLEALKSLGEPSQELLCSLLNLVVEDCYVEKDKFIVHNTQVGVILLQWLPDIHSHDLQIWLSNELKCLCGWGHRNRMSCCTNGMVGTILSVLKRRKQIVHKAVRNLIKLLESLGTYSIQSDEIKQLISLLRLDDEGLQMPYCTRIMRAISTMARRDGKDGALHFFDIQHKSDGIVLPSIKKWPGPGYTFHCWVCLDTELDLSAYQLPKTLLFRRQLYNFTGCHGNGIEAFITPANVLVLAVYNKKEYFTVSVDDFPITDSHWHSIDISHTSSRRPFTQSQIAVYIDGRQKLLTQFKFPNLAESLTNNRIGSPGGTTVDDLYLESPATTPTAAEPKLPSTFKRFFNVGGKSTSVQANMNGIPTGLQDDILGPAIPLHGQIGSICIFHDAISHNQAKSLFSFGPNHMSLFDGVTDLQDLPNKLVCYYNAKACKDDICVDLSYNRHHGQYSGNKCVTWDIKDVINCIGGVQVLFPLLEHVDKILPSKPDTPDSNKTIMDTSTHEETDEWVVVPSSSYADSKLEQNQVAAFLTMIRSILHTKIVNQDHFVFNQGAATIGALLQKVDPKLIDVNVLMAVQLLKESFFHNKQLLYHLYQYVLFDFRIWSKSDFPVRIGHIQYLNTIIKDDRKYFRKKYGVQYILDVIKTYYNNKEEDGKTIRVSLINLIKYYITHDITGDECSQLIAFLITVKEEVLLCEMLDLFLSLLTSQRKYDQFFLIMFEPEMAELIYVLLTYENYSVVFYEKVVKVLYYLLKSDKVYEKSKNRLRLADVGHLGLVSMMSEYDINTPMFKKFVEQVALTDSPQSYMSILAVVTLIHNSGLDVKLEASRQLLSILVSKPSAAKLIARQLGWQESITRLFGMETKVKPRDENKDTPQSHSVLSKLEEEVDSNMSDDVIDLLGMKSDINKHCQQNDINSIQCTSTPVAINSNNSNRPIDLDVQEVNFDLEDLPSKSPGTPMFLAAQQFEDLNCSEDDRSTMSRSSSASIEDLSAIGQRRDRQNSLSQSRSSFSIYSSDSNSDLNLAAAPSRRDSMIQSENVQRALDNLGLQRIYIKDTIEQSEELCQNLLIVLLTLMWKGVDNSDPNAWKERGQVFASLDIINCSHVLVRPKDELKRRLLEMMLHSCASDINDSAQAMASHTMNALQLIQIVHHFLTDAEEDPSDLRYSERILDESMSLLDIFGVWDVELASRWKEMVHLGLSILLQCAKHHTLDLCAVATAKLHMLVQTKLISSSAEASFLIGSLNTMILQAVRENTDNYSFLIPVLKALIDKAHDLMNLDNYLPSLPSTNQSPTFFDDFKTYCQSEEWKTFIQNYINPQMSHFMELSFEENQVTVGQYWMDCHEAMMINVHKRNLEIGNSRLKFQSQIVDVFRLKSAQEIKRFHNVTAQLRNQHLSTLRKWRATKRFFTGERGAWKDRTDEEVHHWKLSNQENFSRMKVKMIQNYNFDPHIGASSQRDNIGKGPGQHYSGDEFQFREEGVYQCFDMSFFLIIQVKTGLTEAEYQQELQNLKVSKEALVSKENIADDGLGDEDWNVISSSSTAQEEFSGKEKLVFSEDCDLVTLVEVIKGRLEVTTTHVYFFDCSLNKSEGGEDFKWALNQLREIHFRRYNLRRSALEMFLIDQTNYFLNFTEKRVRNKVYSRILSLRPSNLNYYGTRSPAELLRASGLTQKWVNCELSNFDYLMQLNTIAGRTYNDLSQYPVFPWILKDYTSESLDLSNENIYRNLSKPMGAVNPKNEADVIEKYETFEDPSGTIEKFHYGTHYSNAAGVIHYMVRMEPFTTLHIQLQSGKFDVADRQFHSIPGSWQSPWDNPNDVKELIPEFFYLPEFLQNINDFDLGKLQLTKEQINDVVLPKWAATPEEFIYKHRLALESDYVSSNLHDWIDLIFGYKQKGQAAVDAVNVFYFCTYEGAVDLDAVKNPQERKALEGMINNFGQTPTQLLKEPHPKRLSIEEANIKATKSSKPLNLFYFVKDLTTFFVEVSSDTDPLVYVNVPRNQARSIIQHGTPDSMITVTENGIIGIHGWLPYDKSVPNYYTFDKDPTLQSSKTKKHINGVFEPGLSIEAKLFTVSHDCKLLFSAGHWDNSLQVYHINKNKKINHITGHIDVITCLALDYCGNHLITGSRDRTCMIWEILQQGGFCNNINKKPVQTLYGHDSEVTVVHISVELDLAVSAGKDGTVIIHTVRKGHYMRTLRPPCEENYTISIPLLAVSDIGQVVLYSREIHNNKTQEKNTLHVYSVNGKHLFCETLTCTLGHFVLTGDHVILGDSNGQVTIKQIFGLKNITSVQLRIPVTCLSVTNGNSHILVCLQDGKLIIIGVTFSNACRWDMEQKPDIGSPLSYSLFTHLIMWLTNLTISLKTDYYQNEKRADHTDKRRIEDEFTQNF